MAFLHDDSRVQKVDSFQLQNLIEQRIRFSFYDLSRQRPPALPVPVEGWLQQAHRIAVDELLNQLLTPEVDKTAPIILICEKGKTSMKVAKKLIDHEFVNVYVVENGLRGLLSK